jgi:hypothetical protein
VAGGGLGVVVKTRAPQTAIRRPRNALANRARARPSNSYSNRFSHASQLTFLKNASTYFARSVAR